MTAKKRPAASSLAKREFTLSNLDPGGSSPRTPKKRCSEPFPVMSSLPPQTAAGMGGFEPVIRVCSRIDMKGEAQFQTGEVWEEGLKRRNSPGSL